MNLIKSIILSAVLVTLTGFFTSCSDDKSYADLLNDENKYVNIFLADQKVVPDIPTDSVFEVGPDAPYYCLYKEGQVYMQVLAIGNGQKAKEGQQIYFRYMMYPIMYYHNGKFDESLGTGNLNNMEYSATSFRYKNFSIPASSAWGMGLQMPMEFLPINSEVNLVIKSQYGLESNMSYVTPYFFHVRYLKSMI